MIENWKNWYRMHSVQVAILVGVVAGLQPYLPFLASLLPQFWVSVAAVLIVVARLAKQDKLTESTPEQVWDEAMKAKDGDRDAD